MIRKQENGTEKRQEKMGEETRTGKRERRMRSNEKNDEENEVKLLVKFNLYQIQSITFLIGYYIFSEKEDTPLEILARGPKAIEAYERAISLGSVEICRTRIVLVGQERVGKTSLLKNLLQIQ